MLLCARFVNKQVSDKLNLKGDDMLMLYSQLVTAASKWPKQSIIAYLK